MPEISDVHFRCIGGPCHGQKIVAKQPTIRVAKPIDELMPIAHYNDASRDVREDFSEYRGHKIFTRDGRPISFWLPISVTDDEALLYVLQHAVSSQP